MFGWKCGKGLSLGEETTMLFDVPSVAEDVAIAVLQSVGAWSNHLHNRVRPFPGRTEPMPVLCRLCPPQHQIANFKGSSPDLPLVVPMKGLLVEERTRAICHASSNKLTVSW
jgi:hypothetical protein